MKCKLLLLCLIPLLGLTGCMEKENNVEVYKVESTFNSNTINKWSTLYLLDEDTYTLTVKAVDSKDESIVTCDFYMSGSYSRENDIVTLVSGHGNANVLNGNTPIEMNVHLGDDLYSTVMGTNGTSYTLNNETFEKSE